MYMSYSYNKNEKNCPCFLLTS